MNVEKLTHPRHLLEHALNKRAEHEAAHLKRLREAAELRAEQRAVDEKMGNPPRSVAGPQ